MRTTLPSNNTYGAKSRRQKEHKDEVWTAYHEHPMTAFVEQFQNWKE